MSHRLESLLAHITTGQTVCPFAKSTRLHVLDLGGGDVSAGLYAFARGEHNALVVPANEAAEAMFRSAPWGLTLSWAREAFLDLVDVLLAYQYPELDAGVRFREVMNVRNILFDDGSRMRPHLHIRARPLMTICMSPMYPRTHPRYAPATCLISTWEHEVAAATQTTAAVLIRETMFVEHGAVYDANELVLPLPKDPT